MLSKNLVLEKTRTFEVTQAQKILRERRTALAALGKKGAADRTEISEQISPKNLNPLPER
jgi:hypothetical protein